VSPQYKNVRIRKQTRKQQAIQKIKMRILVRQEAAFFFLGRILEISKTVKKAIRVPTTTEAAKATQLSRQYFDLAKRLPIAATNNPDVKSNFFIQFSEYFL